MKATIKIKSGRRGWYLQINGLYMHLGFDKVVLAIKSPEGGIPYGATEWVSISALRYFWNSFRPAIMASLDKPMDSIRGEFRPSVQEIEK